MKKFNIMALMLFIAGVAQFNVTMLRADANSDYSWYVNASNDVDVNSVLNIVPGNKNVNGAVYASYPDANTLTNTRTGEGLTALMWAARNNNIPLINYIFDHSGSFFDASNNPVHPNNGRDGNFTPFQQSNWDALWFAVQANNKDAFNAIANRLWGPGVTWGPVHDLQHAIMNNDCATAQQIITANNFTDAQTNIYKDQNGQTPFQFVAACKAKADAAAAAQQQAAAKVASADTALIAAATAEVLSDIQSAITNGADINNAKDSSGRTVADIILANAKYDNNEASIVGYLNTLQLSSTEKAKLAPYITNYNAKQAAANSQPTTAQQQPQGSQQQPQVSQQTQAPQPTTVLQPQAPQITPIELVKTVEPVKTEEHKAKAVASGHHASAKRHGL